MTPEEQIKADLDHFMETGELPDSWQVDETEFDIRLEDMNRERELIESGCYEPCSLWCARPCCAGKSDQLLKQIDPFQRQGAPCFEPTATDEDWMFLFGTDPEESYEP